MADYKKRQQEQERLRKNNRKKLLAAQLRQPSYRFPIEKLMEMKDVDGETATAEAMKEWQKELPDGWLKKAMGKSAKHLNRGRPEWLAPIIYSNVSNSDLKDKVFEGVGIPGVNSAKGVASSLATKSPEFFIQVRDNVDGGSPAYDNDVVKSYGKLPQWFVPTSTIDKQFVEQLSQQSQDLLFSQEPNTIREITMQAKEVAKSKGITPEQAIQEVGGRVQEKLKGLEMSLPEETKMGSSPASLMNSAVISAKSSTNPQGSAIRNSPELMGVPEMDIPVPKGAGVELPVGLNYGGQVQHYALGGGVLDALKGVFFSPEDEEDELEMQRTETTRGRGGFGNREGVSGATGKNTSGFAGNRAGVVPPMETPYDEIPYEEPTLPYGTIPAIGNPYEEELVVPFMETPYDEIPYVEPEVDLPFVNSDESLLQGSSQSVENAQSENRRQQLQTDLVDGYYDPLLGGSEPQYDEFGIPIDEVVMEVPEMMGIPTNASDNGYDWAVGVFQNPNATPEEIAEAQQIVSGGANFTNIPVVETAVEPIVEPVIEEVVVEEPVVVSKPAITIDDVLQFETTLVKNPKDIQKLSHSEVGGLPPSERKGRVKTAPVIANVEDRDIKQVNGAWVSVGAKGDFRPASEKEIKDVKFATEGQNTGANVIISNDVKRTQFIEAFNAANPNAAVGAADYAWSVQQNNTAIDLVNTDVKPLSTADSQIENTKVSTAILKTNSTGNSTVDKIIQEETTKASSVDQLLNGIEDKIAKLKGKHSDAWKKSVMTGLFTYALTMATGGSFAQAMEAGKLGMELGGGDLSLINKQLAVYEGAQGDALTARLNQAIKSEYPDELDIEKKWAFAEQMLENGRWDEAQFTAYTNNLVGGEADSKTTDSKKQAFATKQLNSGAWTQEQYDTYLQEQFFGGTDSTNSDLLASTYKAPDGTLYATRKDGKVVNLNTGETVAGLPTGSVKTSTTSVDLPTGIRNTITKLTDEAYEQENSIVEFNNVLAEIDASGNSKEGLLGKATELVKGFGGWQDGASSWKTNFTRLKNDVAIQSLPPGVASDTDIKIVMQGYPDASWDKEQLKSWIRGYQKVLKFQSDQKNFRAQWMENNRGSITGMISAWKKEPAYINFVEENWNVGGAATGGSNLDGSTTAITGGNTGGGQTVDLDLSNL